METLDMADVFYLITVLMVNSIGFFVIVICYIQIYYSLEVETRHMHIANEMTFAKKMALLVRKIENFKFNAEKFLKLN